MKENVVIQDEASILKALRQFGHGPQFSQVTMEDFCDICTNFYDV